MEAAPPPRAADGSAPPTPTDVLGIPVSTLGQEELFRQVVALCRGSERSLVTYANVHTVNLSRRSAAQAEVYRRARLVYCDGKGVCLGARLLGVPEPEHLPTASFIYAFCETCQREGIRVFLLGGRPGVAQAAAERLRAACPGFQVAGSHHGYFRWDSPQEREVLAHIRRARPHVLLVGFGSPLQERWALRTWDALEVPVVWLVGAVMDFVAGRSPRAPYWMQRMTLEWLYRFAHEPRRLFTRYAVGNTVFLARVLRRRWVGGATGVGARRTAP